MFLFQFVNDKLYSLFGSHFVNLTGLLHSLGERAEHLGWRACKTELAFLDVNLVGTPNLNFLVIGFDTDRVIIPPAELDRLVSLMESNS